MPLLREGDDGSDESWSERAFVRRSSGRVRTGKFMTCSRKAGVWYRHCMMELQ